MQNLEIEEMLREIRVTTNSSDEVAAIHSYIEELEEKVSDLEEENNDLQREIDILNERE